MITPMNQIKSRRCKETIFKRNLLNQLLELQTPRKRPLLICVILENTSHSKHFSESSSLITAHCYIF